MTNANTTAQNNASDTYIATVIPDWIDRVDQSNPAVMCRFFSDMPNAKTITMRELCDVWGGAVALGNFPALSVVLEAGALYVETTANTGEIYYSVGGTHASYGNFALFWSARGPDGGFGSRDRPCFMFWDGEAIMSNPADAA